jgi:hypothetical protein
MPIEPTYAIADDTHVAVGAIYRAIADDTYAATHGAIYDAIYDAHDDTYDAFHRE